MIGKILNTINYLFYSMNEVNPFRIYFIEIDIVWLNRLNKFDLIKRRLFSLISSGKIALERAPGYIEKIEFRSPNHLKT